MIKLSWGKPKVLDMTIEDLKLAPLSADDLDQVQKQTQFVLESKRKRIPDFGFNSDSIKILSDDLSEGRKNFSQDAVVKIANLYGCFLGSALVECYKEYEPAWVSSSEGVGIQFGRGQVTKVAFPIERAFKQIEQGDELSIYAYFIAIPEFIAQQPPR